MIGEESRAVCDVCGLGAEAGMICFVETRKERIERLPESGAGKAVYLESLKEIWRHPHCEPGTFYGEGKPYG